MIGHIIFNGVTPDNVTKCHGRFPFDIILEKTETFNFHMTGISLEMSKLKVIVTVWSS